MNIHRQRSIHRHRMKMTETNHHHHRHRHQRPGKLRKVCICMVSERQKKMRPFVCLFLFFSLFWLYTASKFQISSRYSFIFSVLFARENSWFYITRRTEGKRWKNWMDIWVKFECSWNLCNCPVFHLHQHNKKSFSCPFFAARPPIQNKQTFRIKSKTNKTFCMIGRWMFQESNFSCHINLSTHLVNTICVQ